jgi:hypothetical protein
MNENPKASDQVTRPGGEELRAFYGGGDLKADLMARLRISLNVLCALRQPSSDSDETLMQWQEFGVGEGFAQSETTRIKGLAEYVRIRDGLIAAIERLDGLTDAAAIQAERSHYSRVPFPRVLAR